MDNYNYPEGSDTPDAPWNQSDQEELEVEACVSVCLSKTVKLEVTDYTVTEEYDADIDDEGHSYCHVWNETDFSDCDLKGAYNRQHYTIKEILDKFIELAHIQRDRLKQEIKLFDAPSKEIQNANKELRVLKQYIKDAEEWTVDEEDLILEN